MFTGDPDAGYGAGQPGSWAYNLLPFIEQMRLRQVGAGVADVLQRQELLKTVVTTPLSIWQCPSKRPVRVYPLSTRHAALAVNLFNCRPDNECQVARGDYRINGGNMWAGDAPGTDDPEASASTNERRTGVSYQFSEVTPAQLTDGASRTFLLGEEALSSAVYYDGSDTADDQCIYSGFDNDNVGFTGKTEDDVYLPEPDRRPASADLKFRFGGAHAEGFPMAMCDASVSIVAFDVDAKIFWLLGGRNDEK